MSNPLLQFEDLPPFSAIKPEHVKPAVEAAIADCRQAVDAAAATEQPSWDSVSVPVTEAEDRLGRIWSPVSHMNAVVNSQPLREAYESCLALLSEYSTWRGQHKGLYQAYKAMKDSAEFSALDVAQQKAINDALQDFELSGIALPADQQHRFGEIQKRLSELSSSFSNNVLDATMGWSKLISDESDLAGLPESARNAAKAQAESKSQQGYLFTLDIPSYLPVMMYCDNRALRQEMYEAFTTRASDRGPQAGQWDNTELMNESLRLKHELARLLGFNHYSELSLATKMAETPDQVMGFLNDLVDKARPQGEREFAEVKAYAKEEFGVDALEPWDIPYYSEKLKQARYTISDEALRPYFPEARVLSGLFEVMHRVFGMTITERKGIDTWHESVRFYDIHDSQGTLRGSFYLDLYARENKRGGAWMDECRVRRRQADGELQTPVAYLTCNFNPPVGDDPALFTHDEVVTLFHEFGHGIHHMLTQVDVADVSGINGVPWDAVELPSQFLENWCWEQEALSFISGHYQTGEALPEDMLEKMLAAKNFNSAMAMLRQLEFSLFDFRLFSEFDPEVGPRIMETLSAVREQVSVVPAPEWNRFPHAFGHIFAGGYSAGYYSYKWAEVLSSDAYSRFEEEGIFNRDTGEDFLNHILSRGGSEAPKDLFVRFRGREPSPDALLRHSGITTA